MSQKTLDAIRKREEARQPKTTKTSKKDTADK